MVRLKVRLFRKLGWLFAGILAVVLTASAGGTPINSGWRLVKQMASGTFPVDHIDGGIGGPAVDIRPPRLYDMFFADDLNGWVVGEAGLIAHTRDGGESWTEQFLNPLDNLKALCFVNPQRGWAVGHRAIKGNRGVVLKTDDGGGTWRELYVDNRFRLSWFSGVWFVTDRLGWAVGEAEQRDGAHGAVILCTQDGGKEWQVQYFDRSISFSLDSVKFLDERNGWATGANAILHTTDGGSHWYRRRDSSSSVFDAVNPLGAWVAGGRNLLLHTANGGKQWKSVSIPFEQRILRLVYIKFAGSEGWVMAVDGTIFHTRNGGESWEWDLPNIDEDIQGGFATSQSFLGFTEEGAIFRKDR